jgi:hypothetical protein
MSGGNDSQSNVTAASRLHRCGWGAARRRESGKEKGERRVAYVAAVAQTAGGGAVDGAPVLCASTATNGASTATNGASTATTCDPQRRIQSRLVTAQGYS